MKMINSKRSVNFIVFDEFCFLGDGKERRFCKGWQGDAIEGLSQTCTGRGRIPNGFEELIKNKTSGSVTAFYSCRKHYKLKGEKSKIILM